MTDSITDLDFIDEVRAIEENNGPAFARLMTAIREQDDSLLEDLEVIGVLRQLEDLHTNWEARNDMNWVTEEMGNGGHGGLCLRHLLPLVA